MWHSSQILSEHARYVDSSIRSFTVKLFMLCFQKIKRTNGSCFCLNLHIENADMSEFSCYIFLPFVFFFLFCAEGTYTVEVNSLLKTLHLNWYRNYG